MYTKKILKHFYMDNVHPLNTPIVVRSLDTKKVSFRPPKEDEEIIGPKVPYLSVIGALIYLANCARSNIDFAVNLLARYSFTLIKKEFEMDSNKYFAISTKQPKWDSFIVNEIHI